MFTVTLADGTELTNLVQNGSNYISETEVTKETFADKLATVTISDGETEEVMTNCELVRLVEEDGKWWFAFAEIPESVQTLVDIQEAIAEVYELVLG